MESHIISHSIHSLRGFQSRLLVCQFFSATKLGKYSCFKYKILYVNNCECLCIEMLILGGVFLVNRPLSVAAKYPFLRGM